jgi:hypothetical protein
MTLSPTTDRIEVHEIAHRRSDGIEVRLLWNSQTDRVSVTVLDERSGEAFELQVDSADALAAFDHPYVYSD